jgi:NadR type nicotinamide-nucleotide adenylyltransferase
MAQDTRRICLIGPESTGKTQLAQRLARELNVPWIPEFAREYVLEHPNLTEEDVEPIARGCIANCEGVEAPLAILDTDLISTVVYARHYYGSCPQWIEEEARNRRADFYLLMDTDIEWVADPARDSGGEAREDLFDAFRAALEEFGAQWEIVSGDWETRWKVALRAATRRPPNPR